MTMLMSTMISASVGEKMISCFLCGVGGYQKGSEEFLNHLMHQHGVVFDDSLDFINKLSEFKTVHLKVPDLNRRTRSKPPSRPLVCKKCLTPSAVPEAEPVQKEPRGSALRGETGPRKSALLGETGPRKTVFLGDDGLPSLYGWICTCALCHYTSGDDTTFWSHITKSHAVDWKEYKEQHGTCQTPLNGGDGMFVCDFCEEKVKHWPGNVKKHMLRKHKMTWDEYIESWKRKNPNYQSKENSKKAKIEASDSRATLEETAGEQSVNGGLTKSAKKVKPLNIRDKTNTYCNECDITFSTRIQFLGHCSDVHDVKFKGKMGQPLVIPSVSQEVRQHDSSIGSPARKKARMNSSIAKSPDKKDKDPIPCQYCGKEFSNYFNMERHIRQACKIADNKYELEEKEFKCTVCPRQFSKQGNLKNHMMGEHTQGEGEQEF